MPCIGFWTYPAMITGHKFRGASANDEADLRHPDKLVHNHAAHRIHAFPGGHVVLTLSVEQCRVNVNRLDGSCRRSGNRPWDIELDEDKQRANRFDGGVDRDDALYLAANGGDHAAADESDRHDEGSTNMPC